AAARAGLGIPGADGLAAAVTAQLERRLAAAVTVADSNRRALIGHVAVAPLAKGHQHRIEVEAHLGEAVAVASAHLVLVGLAAEDAGVHQAPEAVGEERARDAQARLEVLEALHPRERLPQDHEDPA